MKKTLLTMALSAAVLCGQAVATELTQTFIITPSDFSTSNGPVANTISPETVYSYNVGGWYGAVQGDSLKGQSSAADGIITLGIGAVAAQNQGNTAAGKFDLPDTAEPLTLSFEHCVSGSWGSNLNNFSFTLSCTVYGYDSTGQATEIGTWTSGTYAGNALPEVGVKETTTITLTGAAYDSYGIVFHTTDTSTQSRNAGVNTQISNITVTAAVPEPATATLSLLALAGLAARRRRK